MKTWTLTYNGFVPEEESLREALCTLGNGYLGTRGAAPETVASRVHYPGTYIAGVYNTLGSEVNGRMVYNEDFVNCPNWLALNLRVCDGPWFDRLKVRILNWKVELNMRKGMLSRRVRWMDGAGRITLMENHRIVSMVNPHLCALSCTITPENYDGTITVRSGIDGAVINAGVERYKQLNSKHLEPLRIGRFGQDGIFLQSRTTQSRIEITEAVRTLVYKGEKRISPRMSIIDQGSQKIFQEFILKVDRGQRCTIEKLASIYTSRDQGVADNCAIAKKTCRSLENFEALLLPHEAKWESLWKRFDIEIKGGNPFVQKAIRLHAFHLLQIGSAYNEDIDAGMPARGLHGEAYRGHVFWDEMFVFPFYSLHAPEVTRALLMYRYRRLPAAKDYARQNGYRGAMFPWQSASTGDETTQVMHLNPLSGAWGPDFSSLQRHVSVSVAYNVWTYYYMTSDRDFMDRYGFEMMLEIALFWSDIARLDPAARRYVIEGVMGPDEYHEKYPWDKEEGGLKNNAYTNVMAVWVIDKALYALDHIIPEADKRALLLKIGITDLDIDRWRDITKRMNIVMDKDGLIHQFEGYMRLEGLDWDAYRRKYENIRRMDRILKAEGTSPDKYQVSKQADVLMLFYMLDMNELKDIFSRLGYKISPDIIRKNYDYYLPRTSHGSSLSLAVHSYVGYILKDERKTMEFFMKGLESDIFDTQGGTTQEGIHSGVMGSTIDIFLRIFAGLTVREDGISLRPRFHKYFSGIKFSVRFKNIWFKFGLTRSEVRITARPVAEVMSLRTVKEIPIEVQGRLYNIRPGQTSRIKLNVPNHRRLRREF